MLAIGGSDTSAGAGIQADLKTIHALGGHALTVVTAITAQTGLGIDSIHELPAGVIASQIRSAANVSRWDAVKVGMVGSADAVQRLACELGAYEGVPIVLDPVLQASDGTALLDDRGVHHLLTELAPLATILTPNAAEAEALTGVRIDDLADASVAAKSLIERGCKNVLLKGGHIRGAEGTDVLVTASGTERLQAPALHSPTAHGSGCALASAIACAMAHGKSVREAALDGRCYIRSLLERSRALSPGSGLLDHFTRALPAHDESA